MVKDKAALARWGMRGRFVNLRAETVLARFRSSGRCLVPASGFYEWKPVEGYKQPFYIHPVGAPLFAFGGVLEHWDGPDGPVRTFAILTTAANELMAPIHDRMPVIVLPEDYDAWLDPRIHYQ